MSWDELWKEVRDNNTKKLVAYGIIAVLIVGLLVVAIPRSHDYVTTMIADMVKQQQKLIQDGYNDIINQKKEEIKKLDKQIEESNKNLAEIQDKINKIEKRRYAIKLPKDSIELRNRFDALGYKSAN